MLPAILPPVPRAAPGRKCPLVRVTGATVTIINPARNRRRRSITLYPPPCQGSDLPTCGFCHQPSYPLGGLGHLFGPYQVSGEETWLHLDCVLWVPVVTMVSGKLLGLKEGVEQCKTLVCRVCERVGASMGCTQHGCKAVVHVVCGKDGGWGVDEDRLDARCPRHRRQAE